LIAHANADISASRGLQAAVVKFSTDCDQFRGAVTLVHRGSPGRTSISILDAAWWCRLQWRLANIIVGDGLKVEPFAESKLLRTSNIATLTFRTARAGVFFQNQINGATQIGYAPIGPIVVIVWAIEDNRFAARLSTSTRVLPGISDDIRFAESEIICPGQFDQHSGPRFATPATVVVVMETDPHVIKRERGHDPLVHQSQRLHRQQAARYLWLIGYRKQSESRFSEADHRIFNSRLELELPYASRGRYATIAKNNPVNYAVSIEKNGLLRHENSFARSLLRYTTRLPSICEI
jgi:hypothetical protein